LALALALEAGLTAPASAQGARGEGGSVRGIVRDLAGRPLAGARVSVLGADAATESDEAGAFRLALVPGGAARIVARRIGFAPETLSVTLSPARGTELDVRLERLAQPLDAVVVNGRRDIRGPMAGFYLRRDRGSGGRFYTQEQIAQRNVTRMSDLLRSIPSLRITSRRPGESQFRLRGSSIAPLVWLDGAPMGAGEVDLDNFDPRSFAGIEIYSGPASVPVEFAGSRMMSTSGGAVVLWTRRGEAAPARRKRGAPTPAELIAGLIERGEAFTAAAVDQPARPVDTPPIVPIYPDSLFEARVPGMVEVEFVVDATGRVRMDTFGLIWTTHRQLGEAVRRSLPSAAFGPAVRAGRNVAQVMQLPFEFIPDSGAVARKPKD
jgi:hypothetical protein